MEWLKQVVKESMPATLTTRAICSSTPQPNSSPTHGACPGSAPAPQPMVPRCANRRGRDHLSSSSPDSSPHKHAIPALDRGLFCSKLLAFKRRRKSHHSSSSEELLKTKHLSGLPAFLLPLPLHLFITPTLPYLCYLYLLYHCPMHHTHPLGLLFLLPSQSCLHVTLPPPPNPPPHPDRPALPVSDSESSCSGPGGPIDPIESNKEEGELSEEEVTLLLPMSSRLFSSADFEIFISKARRTIDDVAPSETADSYPIQDQNVFPIGSTSTATVPFPSLFREVMCAEWQYPALSQLISNISKKIFNFYSFIHSFD
ncbi:uncharacterized protein LOC128348118 [Hemicordylus capensis]|uniref:uncharacterized protein LOC128348118 n=1 Tax=Hemicordylus capensis TaxID=884348 RepID=UPI002304A9E7|nr:uncharacterized protein LOC128348118 [Hemicordylus capensis]XP_053159670.1 uncharacterized protein LOC128348118 [Hemicordylus capensis]XP_053159671.1 uncharacterized protein LOC128348118 [Hemicordylus capensis]XP_053159672.1 uncharacterized protein LOC128348118 [Hemicordylus capensis]XP_053159673.1 uncharacterized protein LOC128348118 [Hemicordylus capensis]XP_053159674.1 uncharacterized protein LOC128348118 [Hemicordylus capensis]XP_053159675.1 uncharacterized protein LOC128348118 [Hemico